MNAVAQLHPAPTLAEIVDAWTATKQSEEAARADRVAIEAQMIALLGERDEGSQTTEVGDGRKVTITAKLTRTLDEDAWRRVVEKIPPEYRPIRQKITTEVDPKGLAWLRENRPDLYDLAATAIETKKAKSSVSVRI